ncbi:Uma2 family endonuclease [Roseibacillus ishigakijimensis]|uniref:Uma2 family endonuclease n=1 Tax=Roseibacillus ishigakijimensis TaxID=454146 RepID=A0A934VM74_9BACT|nr:Uma2 family endonuclease [Roseibacillus ishigakijimensis]MBK1833660.1 Uma2 family endonuclease [Roseibacillus ishigakijimensis]
MAAILDQILASPSAPLHIQRANEALATEATAREKFRDDIQPHDKAEFINGEVIMHSPARSQHNQVRHLLERILSIKTDQQEGFLTSEKALCAFTRNDYEPDILWFGPEKAASIEPRTLIHPVPDFIVEVLSDSTEKRDRGVKFEDYAAHGVAEYWLIEPYERFIEQYRLGDGEYHLHEKLSHGDITPLSFPDLTIPLAAIFEREANLTFLKTLLA